MCPHGRPDFRMCPHCLGVNELTDEQVTEFSVRNSEDQDDVENLVLPTGIEDNDAL